MTKKKTIQPPEKVTEFDLENMDLDLMSKTLEEQAREKLSKSIIMTLKKIAYFIAKVGLPLDEACLLVDVEYVWFQEMMKVEPLIEKIIKIKTLEYKKDLLLTLSQRARSGDDKLAAYLLERRYPEEFANSGKKPSGDSDNRDILFEAIRFIRKNGDNNPMVEQSSGMAVELLKDGGKVREVKAVKIDNILK